jgi:hypothetical protein
MSLLPALGCMNGCIDNIGDHCVFTGWVINHAHVLQGREILVLITCNGEEIGRGKPSFPRFDILRDADYFTGFQIACDRVVSDEDILFGRVSAQFSDRDGAAGIGEIWDNVRARAAHGALRLAHPLGPLAGKLMLEYLAKSGFVAGPESSSPEHAAKIVKSQTQSATNFDAWLLNQFESLGCNCTFGLIQTNAKAAHLGLMQFSDVTINGLMNALANRLVGMGEPAFTNLSVDMNGEYRTSDRRFGLSTHTKIHVGEVDDADFARRQFAKIRYLVRNFLEDIEAGDKILVVHAMPGQIDLILLAELLATVRKIGPAPILYVEAATEQNAAGTVGQIDDGLLIGYVTATPTQHFQTTAESLASWITVCKKAYQLAFDIDDLDTYYQRAIAAEVHNG